MIILYMHTGKMGEGGGGVREADRESWCLRLSGSFRISVLAGGFVSRFRFRCKSRFMVRLRVKCRFNDRFRIKVQVYGLGFGVQFQVFNHLKVRFRV